MVIFPLKMVLIPLENDDYSLENGALTARWWIFNYEWMMNLVLHSIKWWILYQNDGFWSSQARAAALLSPEGLDRLDLPPADHDSAPSAEPHAEGEGATAAVVSRCRVANVIENSVEDARAFAREKCCELQHKCCHLSLEFCVSKNQG